jgi:putative ABC transport system substrate-binding protein
MGSLAQQPLRIGIVAPGSRTDGEEFVAWFRGGLRDFDVVEGRDVTLDVVPLVDESAHADAIRTLLGRGAGLLVTNGTTASVAARRATSTIPILFANVGDPIGIGLVDSLARPGGNATGISDVRGELGGKLVELARDLSLSRTIHYLWHTGWTEGQKRLENSRQAAHVLDLDLRSHGISDVSEADALMAAAQRDGAQILVIQPGPFASRYEGALIDAAARKRIPAITAFPRYAARNGALAAYGPDLYAYRRVGLYVDRILKGARPGDLAVEQPTKFDLVINLKTAKTFGISVSPSILGRATELAE